jgi:hypothetical protein
VFSFVGSWRNTPRITPMAHLTVDPPNPTTPRDSYQTGMRAHGAQDAQMVLTKEAKGPREISSTFDVFLSHSFQDSEVILGVKRILERGGARVYVDWIDDADLDRNNVTPHTADRLRVRISSSHSLVYATSATSKNSKWMPWELGYFDGLRGDRIAILPLVASEGATYVGQEYLGLYPRVERLGGSLGTSVVRHSPTREAVALRSFASPSRLSYQRL